MSPGSDSIKSSGGHQGSDLEKVSSSNGGHGAAKIAGHDGEDLHIRGLETSAESSLTRGRWGSSRRGSARRPPG
jgi:hypothetical protein